MTTHINTKYSDLKNFDQIKNDLLKPLHLYAQYISPKPTEKNGVYTQLLYAEILINFLNDDKIKLISRAATQQFKLIDLDSNEAPSDCFKSKYAFYVSWFIDKDVDVLIKQSSDAICIPNSLKINFNKIYQEPRKKLQEVWVPFFIKKESQYIKSDHGKLDLNMPIYDIMILNG